MEHRGIQLLAAAVLCALLIAPAAEAKKKAKSTPVTVRTASDTTTVPGELVSATATCPKKTIALGGGFDAPIVVVGSGITDIHLLSESRRSGQNAWTVSGIRQDSGSAGPALTLTASVLCRSPALNSKKQGKAKAGSAKAKAKKLKITEVSATGPTAAGGGASSASAVCPGSQRPISGGFSASPPATTSPGSFPLFWLDRRTTPNTWSAAFYNSGSTARAVTSYAYCASRATSEGGTTAALPASSPGNLLGASALSPPCSKKHPLVGGGYENTQPGAATAFPIVSGSLPQAGGSWLLKVSNLSVNAGAVASYGYCF